MDGDKLRRQEEEEEEEERRRSGAKSSEGVGTLRAPARNNEGGAETQPLITS